VNPRNHLPRLASDAGENQPANRRVCATETQATDTQGVGSRADSPTAAPVIIDPEILAALHLITERLNGMSKKLEELSAAVDSTQPAAATAVGSDWKMPPRVDTPGPTPAEVEPEHGQKVSADRHAANAERKADNAATKATRKANKPAEGGADEPAADLREPQFIPPESEGGTPE
jgi:hypothetical protein